MDLRATAQVELISHSHDPTLRITGYGRVSPEWMLPKIMWLKEQQPKLYKKAARICEAADWLGYKLTQQWACNLNNISFGGFMKKMQVVGPLVFMNAWVWGMFLLNSRRPLIA